VSKSILALNFFEALQYLLPELLNLKGVFQSPPHHEDAWHHSLQTADCLTEILNSLTYGNELNQIRNDLHETLTRHLEGFVEKLREHIASSLNSERSLISLLTFAALYHDIGKSKSIEVDEEGEIHFYGHDKAGVDIIKHRAKELRLSNKEIARITKIVRHHMRPMLLAQSGQKPSRRAIYRFFKDTGPAGIDICLLAIADTLATFDLSPPTQVWENLLDVVQNLLIAWFNQRSQSVSPTPLITGNEIIERFGLHPGPIIGELLEVIEEAQIEGTVQTKEEAIVIADRHLKI
jgi:putative nucleotidyltransferase with HDIG domain